MALIPLWSSTRVLKHLWQKLQTKKFQASCSESRARRIAAESHAIFVGYDYVVAGGLAQALAKAKAVSTHALASPHRSRRHASSVQAVGADDANEAAFGGASSSTVYSGAIVE